MIKTSQAVGGGGDDTPLRFDLLSKGEVCRLIGGTEKPIHPATLYRGIRASRYPRPVMVSPNVARWSRAEVEAALLGLMNRRGALEGDL